jgi:DNA-binding NarL/FixJ family response regulator
MTTPSTPLGRKSRGRNKHDGGQDRRIVIVDADHRVRDSFAGLIALAGGVDVVATAGQPAEALSAVRRSRPDIVVLDPRLPEMEDGLALIGAMHRVRPQVHILVLGWLGDHEQLAMDAGADGFICKSADPVTLVESVLAVARHGGAAAEPAIRREIVRP